MNSKSESIIDGDNAFEKAFKISKSLYKQKTFPESDESFEIYEIDAKTSKMNRIDSGGNSYQKKEPRIEKSTSLPSKSELKRKETGSANAQPTGEVHNWKVGDMCVTEYGDNKAFKGTITDLNKETGICNVSFMQFGYTNNIKISEIFKPSEEDKFCSEDLNTAPVPTTLDSDVKWQVGNSCLTKYVEDNMWYLAVVTEINASRCQVKFTGYENVQECLLNDLLMPDDLSVNDCMGIPFAAEQDLVEQQADVVNSQELHQQVDLVDVKQQEVNERQEAMDVKQQDVNMGQEAMDVKQDEVNQELEAMDVKQEQEAMDVKQEANAEDKQVHADSHVTTLPGDFFGRWPRHCGDHVDLSADQPRVTSFNLCDPANPSCSLPNLPLPRAPADLEEAINRLIYCNFYTGYNMGMLNVSVAARVCTCARVYVGMCA